MRMTLAILAAGRSSRFGRPKQFEPVGPSGEALFEYAVYDAIRAGCERVVFITRPDEEPVFRAQALARLGATIPVETVTQRLDDVPPGFRPPAAREAPWGTGHAVLALGRVVREPCIVLNADDFYGPRIIARLVRRIHDALTTGDPSHFLAGYRLTDTPMSDGGGVNRAICRADASMRLERLEEVHDIRPTDRGFAGTDSLGEGRALQPEELCSMNLWAFQPSIFKKLWASFKRFHARLTDPLTDEFLLSTAIGGLVETGRARVRVVPAGERAFGMTFPVDLDAVESGVRMAVATGEYPTDLGEWFERRRGTVPG